MHGKMPGSYRVMEYDEIENNDAGLPWWGWGLIVIGSVGLCGLGWYGFTKFRRARTAAPPENELIPTLDEAIGDANSFLERQPLAGEPKTWIDIDNKNGVVWARGSSGQWDKGIQFKK